MNEGAVQLNVMQRATVHEARNAWVVARPWLSWSLTMLLLCLLLALLGAVNSYGVPLTVRLAFWGSLFGVALIFAIGIEAVLLRSGLPLDPVWRWAAVFTLALALVMTPVAYAANSLGGWAPLSMMVQHLGNSLVISAASVGVRIAFGRMLYAPDPIEVDAHAHVALMDRLPPALRDAQLQAIEADGHYVRIHTDSGSEMVLMRLKDAISETGDIEGMQVHRSWWVARPAIGGTQNDNGRLQLLVGENLTVPVSRNQRSSLRATGWI